MSTDANIRIIERAKEHLRNSIWLMLEYAAHDGIRCEFERTASGGLRAENQPAEQLRDAVHSLVNGFTTFSNTSETVKGMLAEEILDNTLTKLHIVKPKSEPAAP